jgi:hypothetical protein
MFIELQKDQLLQVFRHIKALPEVSIHSPALIKNGGMMGAYFCFPIIAMPPFLF